MRIRSAIGVLLIVFCSACSDNQSSPANRPATPLDLSTVGTITGRVRFEGVPPPAVQLQLGSFAECVAQHPGPITSDDVLVKDGQIQNVLIYVKQGLGERVFSVPDSPVTIDQTGCLFEPHVAAAQTGQPVRFMNSDALAHNVHGVPHNSGGWNFMLPVKGAARNLTIDKPEAVIELKCDVHPWMKAYLGVFNHPYFAVTGPDGRFELHNLPPGNYEIEAWHERFGTRSATASITPKEAKEIEFKLSEK